MRLHSAFSALAVAAATLCMISAAHARDEIDCKAFIRNPDGSWTVIEKTFIPVQNVRVREGTVFRPGGTFLGDDMALRLSRACPNQPVAVPEPPPGQAALPQLQQVPPQMSLGRLADANGNIDAQRLTCAQVADAAPMETEMLLSWYNGWYSGAARKRGMNFVRLQRLTHDVVEYCRAYREKRLSEVLDLWFR